MKKYISPEYILGFIFNSIWGVTLDLEFNTENSLHRIALRLGSGLGLGIGLKSGLGLTLISGSGLMLGLELVLLQQNPKEIPNPNF